MLLGRPTLVEECLTHWCYAVSRRFSSNRLTRFLHDAHKKQQRKFTVTAKNLTCCEANANCETLSCSLFSIRERLSTSLVYYFCFIRTEKFFPVF